MNLPFLTLSPAKRSRYNLNFSWLWSILQPILWNKRNWVMKPAFGWTNFRFALTLCLNEKFYLKKNSMLIKKIIILPFRCWCNRQLEFFHNICNNNGCTSADTKITEKYFTNFIINSMKEWKNFTCQCTNITFSFDKASSIKSIHSSKWLNKSSFGVSDTVNIQ